MIWRIWKKGKLNSDKIWKNMEERQGKLWEYKDNMEEI
jgi:hypothetical protein